MDQITIVCRLSQVLQMITMTSWCVKCYFNQLSLVVLRVLDERASGVVGAKDLLVDELFGEVLSDEGGEEGGGDVGGV